MKPNVLTVKYIPNKNECNIFVFADNHYILIEKKKNWCQAEQYCREQHNSHLVSISNEDQNQDVSVSLGIIFL